MHIIWPRSSDDLKGVQLCASLASEVPILQTCSQVDSSFSDIKKSANIIGAFSFEILHRVVLLVIELDACWSLLLLPLDDDVGIRIGLPLELWKEIFVEQNSMVGKFEYLIHIDLVVKASVHYPWDEMRVHQIFWWQGGGDVSEVSFDLHFLQTDGLEFEVAMDAVIVGEEVVVLASRTGIVFVELSVKT